MKGSTYSFSFNFFPRPPLSLYYYAIPDNHHRHLKMLHLPRTFCFAVSLVAFHTATIAAAATGNNVAEVSVTAEDLLLNSQAKVVINAVDVIEQLVSLEDKIDATRTRRGESATTVHDRFEAPRQTRAAGDDARNAQIFVLKNDL